MKDIPKPIPRVRDDFVHTEDDSLFEFVDTLRLSIKARVAAEQLRGLSLSEIVGQVREMTKLAEQEAADPKPFSSSGFRAISKQAVAWCIEAYQPAVFIEEQTELTALREPPSPAAPVVVSPDRFSNSHQPSRGLP